VQAAGGDQPRAVKLSVGEAQERQRIESDAVAAVAAVSALEAERNTAKQEDARAYGELCSAAREILQLDAADIADKVEVLKGEIVYLTEKPGVRLCCGTDRACPWPYDRATQMRNRGQRTRQQPADTAFAAANGQE
jgi:hypothetical protein